MPATKITIDPLDLISAKNYGEKGIPHEAWTTLRSEAPVQWFEPEGFEPFWAITRHADIMEISGEPERFSNADGIVLLNESQMRVSKSDNPLATMKTIIEMDPPEHRLYRKVASGFFTPRGIDRLDEIVEDSARRLLDALGSSGETDLIATVAERHPLRVLCTILGIEEDEEDRLLELTQQLFAPEDPDLQRKGVDRDAAMMEVGMEFYAMFDQVIRDRRTHPRDDLATLLATAMLNDTEPMGDIETFGYYLIVFNAGHDTTKNALAGALAAFAQHPEQLEGLADNPDALRAATEEVVRWTTPVNYMKRTVVDDTEFRGQQMKAGQRLVLFYASGNRDEDVFDDPFVFDVRRARNRHLGFGWAEHFCLGAHLARASISALINELSKRVVHLELAGEPAQISSSFVVGLKSLPVRYELRATAD